VSEDRQSPLPALDDDGVGPLPGGGYPVPEPPTDAGSTRERWLWTAVVVGTAIFTQVGSALRVVLEVHDLPPGVKAVHVHEVGRCEGPAFTSAGGHFNPHGRQHGALNHPRGPHAGDLPNLTVAADGKGRLESTTELMSLGLEPGSVFDADGSAIIVHAAPDDFRTDPTGNAGARIACGVIERT